MMIYLTALLEYPNPKRRWTATSVKDTLSYLASGRSIHVGTVSMKYGSPAARLMKPTPATKLQFGAVGHLANYGKEISCRVYATT
jgi:hypothetical protein